ncbi:hypothetical protein [Asanoa iriomotensis]|uniref:Uncharacterized protein n=1 Tax=Asanoa iriomotensis TaxID=234613 RepID=A0ABQ4C3N6_9ACTN|nr:hypothetical protein [Asanoa iriomotensis]GIF57408.1 hypothetical protein Air01nite_35030 [Asanoa iriomotensis]
MRGKLLFVQLGALWLLGGLLMPAAVGALVVLLLGGEVAVGVGLVVALVLLVGYLFAVVTVTAGATRLGATLPGRLLWVVLVLLGGTLLWSQGWALADAAELDISENPWLTAVFGGLAYALTAGFLLRGRRLNLAAVAAFLALTIGGLAALRASGPDELEERIASAGINPGLVYVVEVPDYSPSDHAFGDRLGTGAFLPTDRTAIPPLQYVNVVGYGPGYHRADGGPGCGPTVTDSPLSIAECTPEPDGTVYRRGVVEHGYQVTVGDSTVVVSGSHAVDRTLLRAAARSARAGTAKDLPDFPGGGPFFVADVAGFRAQPLGIPPGVQYLRADHTSGDQSVRIIVSAAPAAQGDPCFISTCEPDGLDLTYLRRDDTHGYTHRHGDVLVTVEGGVSVDRALLRSTALAARPATDAELLHALPAAPPRDRFDRLRGWLRANVS